VVKQGHTHELTMGADGSLLGEDSTYAPATDTYRASIWKMSPSGRVQHLVGPVVNPPLGSSIWRDAAGRSYYVSRAPRSGETLLFRRDPRGRVERLLGSRLAAARYRQVLTSIHGAGAFGPTGAFHFHSNRTLRKVTPAGATVTLATNLPTRSFGMTVDERGGVLLTDFDGRRVLRYGPDAPRTLVATSEAPWAPTGVALRGRDLYLLEGRQDARGVTRELRVRRLPSRGRPVTLASVPVS
jgi:hypothetical protein